MSPTKCMCEQYLGVSHTRLTDPDVRVNIMDAHGRVTRAPRITKPVCTNELTEGRGPGMFPHVGR